MLRIIVGMVLFMVTSFALADLEAANKAYDNKDYATAFKLYQEEAKKGSADAQSRLGAMYANGQGVAKDYKQAAVLFQEAAMLTPDLAFKADLEFDAATVLLVAEHYSEAIAS